MGTPVRAAASGTVIRAGWLGGYGNLVVVDHGGELSTAYAHNSSYASTVGQSVAAGKVISYAGSTGDSSGPHVHSRYGSTGAPSTRSATSSAIAARGCVVSKSGAAGVRPTSILGGVDGDRQLVRDDDVQVEQRPPALVQPQPVAGEELVGHGEADVRGISSTSRR